MAEEKKDAPAEEAKKEAPKEGAAAAAPGEGAPKKKGLPIFAIGMGGGGAAIIGMAYFLTVAAVETGASVIPQLAPIEGEEKKEDHGAEAKEGETKPAEGEAKPEGDGHGGGEGEKKEGEAAKAPPPGDGFVELDEIMTNTKGANQKRFVSIKIGLAIASADAVASAQLLQTTGAPKGATLDRLNGLLRSKTVEELEGGGANRELLKREIKEIVNHIVFPKGEGKVTEVFIQKLIVQ